MCLTNVWSRVKVFLPSGRKVPSMKQFLCSFAILGLFLGAMAQVRADKIYWSSRTGEYIQRANLDGSGQTTLVSGTGGALGPALDIAGGQMYWSDNNNGLPGDIRRANLDGSGQTILIHGLMDPGRPALDLANGQIYWNLNNSPGNIMRANLDGTGLTNILGGLNLPNSVALDLAGGKMYWAEVGSGTIRRANLDGSELTTLVTGQFGGSNIVVTLDIAGGKMYWTNVRVGGDIRRANLDGSGQEILVQNLNSPVNIALDPGQGKMYWTDRDGGDIRRANLDGSGQEILITGLNAPSIIALDLGAPGTALYFAVAAPASASAGSPFDITVTALDPYGNTAVNYQGTVTFSTSDTDPGVVLPADYTFTAADAGVQTFTGGVTLITPGDQTITATDTASGITRSVTVTVVPPG
jgi:Domain of unknown function (DUF5050)